MTAACYLARGAHPLRKPTTCEECYVHDGCKMFANFKALEKAANELIENVMKKTLEKAKP